MDELKKPAPLRKFSKRNHGKKKLKTLRRSVLDPLIIAISVINVVMIIFFNLVVLLMLYSNVVSDINSISGTMEQLIAEKSDGGSAENYAFNFYEEEMGRRNISYRINMFVADGDGNIVRFADGMKQTEETAITDALRNGKGKDSGTVQVKADKDIIILKKINVPSDNSRSCYIYVSLVSLLVTIKSSDQALLVIVAFSVLCFVLSSFIIAHNISKPIKKLSDHMEVIGDGDFTPVEIEETTEELHTLVVNINEMLARLEAYKQEHNRSMQNLSHDLKTPLMSISGYAEAIKYGVMDTDEAADVIIGESKRLTEVVEKILILSDLDALSQPVNMEQLDLKEFLRSEEKRIEGYAMQNDAEINCIFATGEEKGLADRKLLSTVTGNLLSNAIRYANKTVDVYCFDEENGTNICVADDGNGLSDEDIKYLFVRYYVGHTGHSGLGLSIAKSAAEYMGCTLRGENRNTLPENHPCRNGTGAVFTVFIPKKQ